MVKCKDFKFKDLMLACILIGITLNFYFSGQLDTITKISKEVIYNVSKYKTTKTKEREYIPDNYTGVPCNFTLDLPQEKTLEKIESYEFPGIENYTSDLFPVTNDQHLPQYPVFVSAFSSNHYEEGLAMIYQFNKMINVKRTRKLIVYDIGLSNDEVSTVKKNCRCEVRRFPFEKYPSFIGTLLGCPWKPIVIQLVAREHPFVVWMDASIRFKTSKLDQLVQKAKSRGVMVDKAGFWVSEQTSISTFRFLNEMPCLYKLPEMAANFIVIYETSFIQKYLMIPWVSCALIKGCMTTYEDVKKLYNCNGKRHYFHCHRYDQSVFSILMYRLFNKSIANHLIGKSLHWVCWGCKKME